MAMVQKILRDGAYRVVRVELSVPPMGGKCFLLESKGLFILEVGPGVLRTIACTHAGSGSIEAIDGMPNDEGFFPDQNLREPSPPEFETHDLYVEAMKKYCTRNGRSIYRGNPVVMGSWFLDAGFEHGLTIRAEGGHDSATAIASIVFMPWRQRK